jgi:hypothetical protein
VPTDVRDDQIEEIERELAGELECDDELAELDIPLDRLLELRRRIDQGQLEPDDRALLSVLIRLEMKEMT